MEHLDTLPVDSSTVFAELVCADPGLLRAEFDALIAANYPTTRRRSPLPSPTVADRPVPD